MTFAVVMVRSTIDVKPDIGQTLRMLRLHHINHCVLVPEDVHYTGMLRKVKDYVTWGEVDEETIRAVLAARGRVTGDAAISDEFLKRSTGFKTVDALSAALAGGEVKLKDVEGVKPVLRLAPPRQGWKGIKRSYRAGGALGYRGDAMNDLLRRMI